MGSPVKGQWQDCRREISVLRAFWQAVDALVRVPAPRAVDQRRRLCMLRGFATRRKEQARLEAIIASSGADLDSQLELPSVEYQKCNETHEVFIPVGERLGGQVIEFRNARKSFGDRLVVDRLSFSVPPGSRSSASSGRTAPAVDAVSNCHGRNKPIRERTRSGNRPLG